MEKFRRKRPTAVSLRCLYIKKDYRLDSFFTSYIAVYSYNSPTIPRPLDKVFFCPQKRHFAHFVKNRNQISQPLLTKWRF